MDFLLGRSYGDSFEESGYVGTIETNPAAEDIDVEYELSYDWSSQGVLDVFFRFDGELRGQVQVYSGGDDYMLITNSQGSNGSIFSSQEASKTEFIREFNQIFLGEIGSELLAYSDSKPNVKSGELSVENSGNRIKLPAEIEGNPVKWSEMSDGEEILVNEDKGVSHQYLIGETVDTDSVPWIRTE